MLSNSQIGIEEQEDNSFFKWKSGWEPAAGQISSWKKINLEGLKS